MASQRAALESRARESNISESDLYQYIDMMKKKVRDRSSSSDSVESLTWEHFFPGECFPGSEAGIERTVFKMELEDAQNPQTSRLDRIFSDGLDHSTTRAAVADRGNNRWIHDKYSPTLSSPTKHIPPSSEYESFKLPDYYKPSGSLLRSDHYRPARDGGATAHTSENVSLSMGHSQTPPSKGIPTGPRQDESRSQDEELRSMAISNGITTQRFDMVQKICKDEVRTKHPNKVLNPEWLEWAAQSMMWSYFSFQKPFPFKEPHSAFPRKGASTRSGALEPLRTLSNGVTKEVDKRGSPWPTEYFTLEKQMEDKVKQRGGQNARRQFFQYLQRMRDQTNSEHKHCEKAVKHFIADSLTWKQFFKEPFPGNDPIGGHTKECIKRSMMANDTSARLRQPLPARPVPVVRLPPSIPAVQIPHQVQAQSQAQMPAKKPELESPTPPQEVEPPEPMVEKEPESMHDAVLQVNGNLINCSLADIKNIAYSIMQDDKFEMVAKAFKCKFKVSHIDKSGKLMLESISLEEGISDWPGQFLLQWATKILEGDPVEMSSYFLDYCQANGAPKDLVEGIALQVAGMDSWGGKWWLDSSNGPGFECADQQWEQYAEAFAACDIDRMMMEESAKAEGLLRMVHDEESGELISLEEFKKRTLCRFVGLEGRDVNSIAEAAPTSLGHAAKRKVDEDDDQTEREEKRVKVDVDAECFEEDTMV